MENKQRDYVHDIRNALGGIAGYAALLEEDLKEKPELKKMATRIQTGVKNLNEILSAMIEEQKTKGG